MKISQEEKENVRRRIIQAAVTLAAKTPFHDVTMREIAKKAGIADATIYKYFSSKEKIVFAFFRLKLEDVVDRLREVQDFSQCNFQEQFHLFLDTELDVLGKDREFFKQAYNISFLNGPVSVMGEIRQSKEFFFEIINDLIAAAVEVGEFPEPAFKSFLLELLWDYNVGIIYYWLFDESQNRVNTTQIIDKSLNLITEILKGAVISKLADLAQFLFREHVISRLGKSDRPRNFDLQKIKRQFMHAKAAR